MLSNKIVIKNSFIGTAAQICSMLLSFVSQRFFLMYLGLEILGIQSVVGETLGFLAFAELGVGTAIVYRLYKPMAENNQTEIAKLMNLYRYLYRIIGAAVFLVGLVLMVFLPVFINDATMDMQFIRLVYMVQLFSTASTYFFAYKRSLIYVDQKQFVCKIVDIAANMAFTILRIITLITFHNYFVYLGLQFVQVLTANIILSVYCDRKYPYIRQKISGRYENIKDVFIDTKDILIGRVAGYVYSSTDNLVISTFSGIVSAGGFSNYKYVTNSVKNLVNSMTDSITATIGNFVQLRTVEESFRLLKRYTFIRYFVANIVALGLCICTDDLVAIAFGEQYLMEWNITMLIVTDIYIGIVYGPLGEFTSALGYFSYEKYINVAGAAINIGASIFFVQSMGIQGVLLGTCISQLFFWIAKSILMCRIYFADLGKLLVLWKWYGSFIVLTGGQIILTKWAIESVVGNQVSVIGLIVKAMLCVLMPIIVNTICYFRTDEYQYLMGLIKQTEGRIINKSKG